VIRKQLTLFLESNAAASIESIRAKYNPEQQRLIKSHITLCREDEIENLEIVQKNLENLKFNSFELRAGELVRFSEGKGLLISIKDVDQKFKNLRSSVLQDLEDQSKNHLPHITLMHPRNSTCNNVLYKDIQKINIPNTFLITSICLIEQEIGKEWKTLSEYKLGST